VEGGRRLGEGREKREKKEHGEEESEGRDGREIGGEERLEESRVNIVIKRER
jgi:hypothetical protein